MHHCRCRQGFSSFFQKRSDGLWRDGLDKPELDGFAGQHAQGPMLVPIRDGAAGDGDEVGVLRAAERLAIARLSPLAEYRIEAALGEACAHAHRGVAADAEGAADLGEAPALAQFEQDLSPRANPGGRATDVDTGVEACSVDFR
jgi:hypothetical protein